MATRDVEPRTNGMNPSHLPDPLPSGDRHSLQQLGEELRTLARTLSGPLHRLSMRSGDCEISVEWDATAPAGDATGRKGGGLPSNEVPAPGAEAEPATTSLVRAPLVGTYFAAPAPGAEPFVRVGQTVEKDQTLAIVEAMKMMNSVVAAEPGVVAELLVTDGQSVEFDQPLIVLIPSETTP